MSMPMIDPGDPPATTTAESTAVQLTRIEGVLRLVAYQGETVGKTVERHGEIIGTLQSTTQRLSEQAEGAKATAVALALALKEADETRRTRTETAWTPVTRLAAVIAGVAAAVAIYATVIPQ